MSNSFSGSNISPFNDYFSCTNIGLKFLLKFTKFLNCDYNSYMCLSK